MPQPVQCRRCCQNGTLVRNKQSINRRKKLTKTFILVVSIVAVSRFIHVEVDASASYDPSLSGFSGGGGGGDDGPNYTYYSQSFTFDLSQQPASDDVTESNVINNQQASHLRNYEKQSITSSSPSSPTVDSMFHHDDEYILASNEEYRFGKQDNTRMRSDLVSSQGTDNDNIDSVTFVSYKCNNGISSQYNNSNDNQNCFMTVYESDDENDCDDDDDNDSDDGHSSMLSTKFLTQKNQRMYAYAGGNPSYDSSNGRETSYYDTSYRSKGNKAWKDSLDLAKNVCLQLSSRYISERKNIAPNHNSRHPLRRRNSINGGRLQKVPSFLKLRGGDSPTSASSEISQKLLVTALVTLIFEGMIGHILEFLKIVMQTSSGKVAPSYLNVIQEITSSKGFGGLWDGFCPWGIIQALSKGAIFGMAHATTTRLLDPLVHRGYIPSSIAMTLAGGIGGGFQGFILSPTLLLKTRVMTNPIFRENMSLLKTSLLSFQIGYDVVKGEGLLALMKGSNVFALKRVFDWSTRYYFSDLFELLFLYLKNRSSGTASNNRDNKTIKKETLTVAEKSVASLLGGVASTCFTLPLDVLVAKTQDSKKAGVQVSALKLFLDELNEKGLKELQNAYMRGFEARLLHVCLTTVVIKTFTPVVYDLIFGAKKA